MGRLCIEKEKESSIERRKNENCPIITGKSLIIP